MESPTSAGQHLDARTAHARGCQVMLAVSVWKLSGGPVELWSSCLPVASSCLRPLRATGTCFPEGLAGREHLKRLRGTEMLLKTLSGKSKDATVTMFCDEKMGSSPAYLH